MATTTLPVQAPFPYFGGKRTVADVVWRRFGDVPNYVEPFFGSGAVLLNRPSTPKTETINDVDGMVANFWRAVQHNPEAVANHADNPVSENDLHSRHAWLVGQKDSLQARLEGDPEFYDTKVAGWWCWGMCCWIGSGFCSGKGPWRVVNRKLVHLGDAGRGVNRQRVHLGDAGRGVNRKLVHLGNAGRGVNRKLVHLGDAGRGVNHKLVHLGDAGRGVNHKHENLTSREVITNWMCALADRLRAVRVCCGDWQRVTGPSPTIKQGLTGVFMDPPYSQAAQRTGNLYRCDDEAVAQKVREWCLGRGEDRQMRIALCGYEGEYKMPESWECFVWKARGGYASQFRTKENENAKRERIWFSPHCLRPVSGLQQTRLF